MTKRVKKSRCLLQNQIKSTMYWAILLLPGVVSEMSINIFGDQEARVEVSGSQTDVISDAERSTFHINDEDLKSAAKKFFGKSPDNIFVRGPTPWNDLYTTYKWVEVSRTLIIKNAKILSYRAEETVIASKNYHNDGKEPEIYSAVVTQLEENTIRHFWTRVGYVTVTQKIDYNVNVGPNGTDAFSKQNSFLEDGVNFIPAALGSKSSTSITLEAGETAVAVLTATKGNINIEVEFEASLTGYAAANYALTYKDHHFHIFEINALLDAAGLPKTRSWKETIAVDFLADERVMAFSINGTLVQ